MSGMIDSLASAAGIDVEAARKGLGAVLEFLKKHLGAGPSEALEAAVPDAPAALAAYREGGGAHDGGLLATVTSLAGKLFGGQGGAGADLLGMLSKVGLSADQIAAFLPKVFEMLKQHLPADLFEKVQGLLPQPAAAGAAGGD